MRFKVTPADQSTRMLFSTTRITAYLGDEEATGTGFFYDSGAGTFLVTNKHVIDGANEIAFPIHTGSNSSLPHYVNLGEHKTYTTNFADWIQHPDPSIDLCCIPVSRIFKSPSDNPIFVPISSSHILKESELEQIPASISVAMIGYPNGLWDEVHGLPIIRRGTTASHPSIMFNNRKEIVLDMACFPGSSGSPVMILERSYFAIANRFLGVLYAGPTISNIGEVLVSKIPTSNQKYLNVQTMMHLGFIVTANALQEFIESIDATC